VLIRARHDGHGEGQGSSRKRAMETAQTGFSLTVRVTAQLLAREMESSSVHSEGHSSAVPLQTEGVYSFLPQLLWKAAYEFLIFKKATHSQTHLHMQVCINVQY